MDTAPLTVADVVTRTGKPKSTVLYDIVNRKLKAHKLSGATGAYVITEKDLADYLANQAVAASKE